MCRGGISRLYGLGTLGLGPIQKDRQVMDSGEAKQVIGTRFCFVTQWGGVGSVVLVKGEAADKIARFAQPCPNPNP